MKDNDIYTYISKAEIFIYRLRSLYKNTSRQVIKSSEYKPYRFFEKRTIRIKSERPYCEMSRWHWVTILILNRLANCLIDYNDKNLIIYWVALGYIPQYWGQAMKSERWILSEKLHIGEELYPMVRGQFPYFHSEKREVWRIAERGSVRRPHGGAYKVGKSLTSIWVFLYLKVDFIKKFLYNIYIRKIYAGIAQLARAADL